MKLKWLPGLLAAVMLVSAACGPALQTTPTSPAQGAAVSAYSIRVTVSGPDGQAISWARAVLNQAGSDIPRKADEAGQMAWDNLPSPAATLSVFAQGYSAQHQPLSLVQGANTLAVVLQLDPLQVNPAKACSASEKLLYIEDFEDGQAQDFDNLVKPKWRLANLPERGIVLVVDSPGGNAKSMSISEYGNAVWKFDLRASRVMDLDMIWHFSETMEGSSAGQSRYAVVLQPGKTLELNFARPGENGVLGQTAAPAFAPGEWHSLAIASYKGSLAVWLDGAPALSAEQENSIEKGKFGFQVNPATQGEISFDNLVVCGLSAPYAPAAP